MDRNMLNKLKNKVNIVGKLHLCNTFGDIIYNICCLNESSRKNLELEFLLLYFEDLMLLSSDHLFPMNEELIIIFYVRMLIN